jgi:hypothetical protein
MHLLVAVPPGHLDTHTDLLINLSLTAQYFFCAVHALLYILPHFFQRFRQRLVVLLD